MSYIFVSEIHMPIFWQFTAGPEFCASQVHSRIENSIKQKSTHMYKHKVKYSHSAKIKQISNTALAHSEKHLWDYKAKMLVQQCMNSELKQE